MSVTRRGFLGIGAAILGGALLPGKDPTPALDPEYGALVNELAKNGLRHEKPQFEELGKIFAEEIQATMQRPSFSDRVFEQHYAPVEKEELLRSGKVGVLTDFHITGVSAVEGTEFGYALVEKV
jgi:hypothetical protein